MNLTVSNIAWQPEEEVRVADALVGLGVTNVEIAPTKVFADPTVVTRSEAAAYQAFWQDRGIGIRAFQSMLFGRPDLVLFEDRTVRRAAIEHLKRFIELAGSLGAGVLVFGSPRNRRVPDDLDPEVAWATAIDVFRELGEASQSSGTTLCLEPNPPQYDCNFVTTAAQGIALVNDVAHPGFKLHLDVAAMTLAGDDVAGSISAGAGLLRHWHISAPQLGEIEDQVVDHVAASAALDDIGYAGYRSIEMRPGEDNVARVTRAVTLARRYYEDETSTY